MRRGVCKMREVGDQRGNRVTTTDKLTAEGQPESVVCVCACVCECACAHVVV